MATVHRAIERGIEGFERVVALKRLLPHLAEDEGFVRAFVREAKLASMLQHANIVQLYELGRVGPSYFISMEYIPGRDLRVILRQARRVCGPPSVEIALALLTELLDALDYAHSQCGADGQPLGLVHRDISPSNLLVGITGHLKVIDFGIAKATLGHLMTHTGRIKGKLSYMAPELLAGRTPDGRSDLFSASVIAHEILTATPLFAAKDDFQTIDRLQNMQPPAPSTRNTTCPPELDEIVLRGLAKDPNQRWHSASEMRAALADLAIHQYPLATNREVADWVEDAFEMPLPSRMCLPPTPPLRVNQAAEHRRSGPVGATDSDDEIMDIVWGVTSPRSSMAVVLDEVPDVSRRLTISEAQQVACPEAAVTLLDPPTRVEPTDERDAPVGGLLVGGFMMSGEDDPTEAARTRSFDLGAREAEDDAPPVLRGSFRSGGGQALSPLNSVTSAATSVTPSTAVVGSRSNEATVAARRQRTPDETRAARPSAWALGTSRNPQQQPAHRLVNDTVARPRRAEPLPIDETVARPRRAEPLPIDEAVARPRRAEPLPINEAVARPRRAEPLPINEAVARPRRAEPLPDPATVRFPRQEIEEQRPSPVPLLVASVAVAVAGATLAWIIATGDDDEPAGPVPATQPVAQSQARVEPLGASEPATGAGHSMTAAANVDAVGKASPGGLDERQGALDAGWDRVADGRKRRLRARRDGGQDHERGPRERNAHEVGVAASEEGKARTSDTGEEPGGDRAGGEREGGVEVSPTGSESRPDASAAFRPAPAAKPIDRPANEGGHESVATPPAPIAESAPARPPETRPREPIIVPSNRTRREGSMPPIPFSRGEQPPKQITAKLCIDTQGTVTSVTVLSPMSAGVRSAVQRVLSGLRYRPVVERDEKIAACFATTFRVQVE